MHPNAERYDQNFSPWTQTTAAALVLLAFLVSQAASAEPAFSVAVPGKTITLLQDEWIKMEDPTTVGKNFEERKKGPWHQLGRVVTIVPLPMSDDRRIGLKIADREYVEIFIAHPGFVTVQTRIDKGTYWVMCAHSALRADSQRGDRWPCPRPHMNGNYLNIKHKKWKFLYDRETFLRKADEPPVDLSPYKPLGTDDRERLWFYYQDEIDTTRHLLHSRF